MVLMNIQLNADESFGFCQNSMDIFNTGNVKNKRNKKNNEMEICVLLLRMNNANKNSNSGRHDYQVTTYIRKPTYTYTDTHTTKNETCTLLLLRYFRHNTFVRV